MLNEKRGMRIVKIPCLFHRIWSMLMKFVKRANERWRCNSWYSLRNTPNSGWSYHIFNDSKNKSQSQSTGVGEVLVSICFSRLSLRLVQTMASRCDSVDFFDSRWGGVEKMKKSHSRWGGVVKCENRTPTLGADDKTNEPHAAWECRNWFLRHLSSENVVSAKDRVIEKDLLL